MAGQGLVFTFYSYKGGVGRSMAAANIALLLARAGKQVLLVDWDLEAPGLDRYLAQIHANGPRPLDGGVLIASPEPTRRDGIVELIAALRNGRTAMWRDCVEPIIKYQPQGGLSFIRSGASSKHYINLVQEIRWEEMFSTHGLGPYLNKMRDEWATDYDITIVDSRTGISDIGGICTILLPDILVVLFTANEQSIAGCAEIIERAREGQDRLPTERERLVAVPILSRDDRSTEYEQSVVWRQIISARLGKYYRDWLPRDVEAFEALQKLYIPYSAYWSFGERLPVFESDKELSDPSSLASSYQRIAVLLSSRLDWTAVEGLTKNQAHEALQREINELSRQLKAERERHAKALQVMVEQKNTYTFDKWIGIRELIVTATTIAVLTVIVFRGAFGVTLDSIKQLLHTILAV